MITHAHLKFLAATSQVEYLGEAFLPHSEAS